MTCRRSRPYKLLVSLHSRVWHDPDRYELPAHLARTATSAFRRECYPPVPHGGDLSLTIPLPAMASCAVPQPEVVFINVPAGQDGAVANVATHAENDHS